MTKQFHPLTGSRGIEWCDETRNATGGCMHGCRWIMPDGTIVYCYAMILAENGVAKAGYPFGFDHHYWRPSALKSLASGSEPKMIFCDSMSDMFAANVPSDHVRQILAAMRIGKHHTYLCLTKAAPMLLKYLDLLPPNLWIGVSSPPDYFCGNWLDRRQQEAMLKNSMDVLAKVKAATGNIVWMSAEPVSWDLAGIIGTDHPLDWVVVGAASNGRKYYQPDPEHIRRLLNVFDGTGTPVFFKGNIKAMFDAHDLGTPEFNRWREDFPANYRTGEPIPAIIARQQACIRNGWPTIAGFYDYEANAAGTRLHLPVIS